MKSKLRKVIAWILVFMLMSADICAIAATLKLPNSLTIIDEEAFYGATSIDEVVVPDEVTEIRSKAFADSSLTEINLPESIEYIADDAFDGCEDIDMTAAKDTYAYDWAVEQGYIIPDYVFNDFKYSINDGECTIEYYLGNDKNVKVPHSIDNCPVTIIGQEAFNENTSIETVTLPETITAIQPVAFAMCSNLRSINIPNSVTEIGRAAFTACEKLEEVHIPDGIVYIEFGTFNSCTSLKSIEIPESVEMIYGYSFAFTKLETIILPTRLRYIDSDAFMGCEDLTVITSKESLAYEWANSMGYTVKIPEVFNGFEYLPIKDRCIITRYLGEEDNVVIPEKIGEYVITGIGKGAFKDCKMINHVAMPDSVRTIGDNAFYGCSSLKSIYLSENISEISDCMFYGCNNLTELNIPGNVLHIGSKSFYECSSLTYVDLGKNVASIDNYAFFGCEGLKHITIPEKVDIIPLYCFSECSGLEEVFLPEGLYGIGFCAFSHCSSMLRINMPDSISIMGELAFGYCESLKSMHIPLGLTSIPRFAFYGCTSLETVDMHNNIKEIEEIAFYDCASLLSINIPEGITVIGDSTFSGCLSLKSIKLPNSLIEIGSSAFSGCSSLNEVEFGNNLEKIGEQAFSFCSSLNDIVIPNSVKQIDSNAFTASSIVSISLPDSLQYISDRTFANCKNLQSIRIPDSVTSIDVAAFFGCSNLKHAYVPESVTHIESRVFEECSPELVIYGTAGSYAETYAEENGIAFVAIEMDDDGDANQFGENYIWTIDSAAAELVYIVNSPTDWAAIYVPDWVTLSESSGSSSDSITVSVGANTGMDRTDYVRFESDAQHSDLIIQQSGDAGKSLADPVITYPADDNAVVELVDVHVLWNKVEGADRYIFSLRDLTTDSLLAYHMDTSDDTTATEITLPVTYFAAGHSYRVAIGAVAEGTEFYEATTSWAERVFKVECTIDENRASLSGRVVSNAGNPIEGALVSIYTSAGYYDNVRVATAITEADGRWNCNGLRRGTTYYCNAEKHNYSFLNCDVAVTASKEQNVADSIIASDSLENEVIIFNAFPTQWECSEETESIEAYITSNDSWRASADVDWITLSTTSGNESAAIGIDVAANTDTEARIGTITVTSNGEIAEISIMQEAATALMLRSNDTVITENTTISSGDNITYPGDLIVKDDMWFHGGTITVEGNMIVKAKGRIDMSDGGTINVNGDFTFDSNMNHAEYLTEGTIDVKGDVEIKRNFYASGNHEFHVSGSNVHKINMWNKWIAQDQHFNSFAVDGYGIEKLNIKEPFSCLGDFVLDDWSILLQNSGSSVFSLEQTYTSGHVSKAPKYVLKNVQVGIARAIGEYADKGRKDPITGIRYIKVQKEEAVYGYLKDDCTVGYYGIDVNIFNMEISKDGKAGFGTVTYHDYATGKKYDFLITSSREEIYNAFLAFHQVVKDFVVTGLQDGFEGTCKDVVKSLILDQLPPLLVDAYTITKEMCSNKSTLNKCYGMIDKL